jgi:DNA-binding NtrC family response regulator
MNAIARVPPCSKGRVLCIDDEPHVLRALQWLLQKDFEVHACGNAADALRLLRRHDFDVVVSDQRMPGITGVEFLRHVRKLAPRAMRILLTGYSDLDAMVKSVNESEVYRFITKPWDVRALPQLIAEAAEVARNEPVPVEAEAGEDAQPRQVTTVALQAPSILLVIDDQPELHTVVAESLGASIEVLHAYDLASALTLLDSRPVAIIVSEIRVGGMDATRLLRMMKASHAQIVTLVASGQKDAQTVMALINQGQVFRILPKPLKPAFVKLLVDAALVRHRQLVESPSVARRFAVEATGEAVAESLYRDIMAAGMGAAPPAHPDMPVTPPRLANVARLHAGAGRNARPAQAGHVQVADEVEPGLMHGLKAGFRRLFGG